MHFGPNSHLCLYGCRNANCTCLPCPLFLEFRVRFLFGGKHGEFRFLPPPGFAPCSDALLPGVELKVGPCQKYILARGEGKQELIGPLVPATPLTFTPTPVDISEVNNQLELNRMSYLFLPLPFALYDTKLDQSIFF